MENRTFCKKYFENINDFEFLHGASREIDRSNKCPTSTSIIHIIHTQLCSIVQFDVSYCHSLEFNCMENWSVVQ